MTERVAVVTPEGEFGTIDAQHVDSLVEAGGRVLTKAQVKERALEQQYQAQPTWKKVATVASMAGPIAYPAHIALRAQGGQLPPELEAYVQGVSEGMTGNLASVGLKEATRIAGGNEAAKAYVQTAEDVREAHPTTFGAGVVGGLIGGAVAGGPKGAGGLGKVIPGVGIGAVGQGVEHLAAPLVAGLAERGVAGKAAAAAATFAARGASEGALYAASSQLGDNLLAGRDAGEKLWTAVGSGALGGALAGGVLGGAGSLVKSGASAALERSGLTRALAKGAPEAEALAGRAESTLGDVAAETEASAMKPSGNPVASVLDDVGGARGKIREVANDQAWRSLNSGGLSPTKYVKKVERFLPNGTNDVGETLLRRSIIDTEAGTLKAAMNGKPAELVPRIQAERASVGTEIGNIIDNSGAAIPLSRVADAVNEVIAPLEKKAGFEGIAGSVREYGNSLLEKLGMRLPDVSIDGVHLSLHPPETQAKVLREMLEGQTVSARTLFDQRRALDELVWRESQPLNASARVEEMRALRAKLEDIVTHAIDEADSRVAGDVKANYKALKKDYFALSVAEDVASDSAARQAKNASHSLTDKIVGATVGGAAHVTGLPGLIAGPAAMHASKIVRERANAATAVFLHRLADSAAVARAITQVDEAVQRAAKGLMEPKPLKALPPVAKGALVVRAQQAMQRVSDAQADPQGYINRLQQQTSGLAATHPQLATSYIDQSVRAASFLASKMPIQGEPDPFDKHPAPKMTSDEAHTFMRYVEYVDRPMKFFEDMEHGKITFEGAEVAQELMPAAFAALQARTATMLAEMRTKPTFVQRQKLGLLLNFPATVAQQPQHTVFLQSLMQPPKGGGNVPPAAAPAPPRRPLQSKTQQSALDRLEAK